MAFEIVITEVFDRSPANGEPLDRTERYRQTVDTLDLRKVIDSVNYKPRVRKAKVDKA